MYCTRCTHVLYRMYTRIVQNVHVLYKMYTCIVQNVHVLYKMYTCIVQNMQHVHIRCMWFYRVNMTCVPYVQDVTYMYHIVVLYLYLSTSLTLWILGELVYLAPDCAFSSVGSR